MEKNETIKGIITSIFDAFKRGDTKEIEKHLHKEASVWDVFTPQLIIGEKEQSSESISLRKHSKGDLGQFELNEFVEYFENEVKSSQNLS